MPSVHTVRQGECLVAIARLHGFADYRVIYNDPRNEGFRAKRHDPNVIYPGDEVVIPDRDPVGGARPTGRPHIFKVPVSTRVLRLVLQDFSGEPMARVPYTLLIRGQTIEAATDEEGVIEHPVPIDEQAATLVVNGVRRVLRIGHLNPAESSPDEGVSGIQARLKNLGYRPGRIDGAYGPRTRAAIQAFQSDHGMDPDGELTDALRTRVRKEHRA